MAKNPCPPCEEGLPAWMGTFADMMTLLMCFFVLLFAMSSLDPVKMQQMQQAAQKKLGLKNEGSPKLIKNELEIQTELKEIVEELDIDEKAKVIGIKNIRVVDASILPQICFGNINATVMMIGEKISQIITDEYR